MQNKYYDAEEKKEMPRRYLAGDLRRGKDKYRFSTEGLNPQAHIDTLPVIFYVLFQYPFVLIISG